MADMTCRKCGQTYPEQFFERAGRPSASNILLAARRPTCRGCQQTASDEKKRLYRPRMKATSTLRHHGIRLVRFGKIQAADELVKRYDWDVDQMTHDIEHAFANGCCYCRQPFSEMPHGMADLTLDIYDRRALPYYGGNTRWVCRTCNMQKATTDPDEWNAIVASWRRWRDWHTLVTTDPLADLPLFAQSKDATWNY